MTESQPPSADAYNFTSDWFSHVEKTWLELVHQTKPRTILEIGSFEGRSACWMIDTIPAIVNGGVQLTCIDAWEHEGRHPPGVGNAPRSNTVESRFDHNVSRAVRRAVHPATVRKIRARSIYGLATLLAEGKTGAFDMVYVDGGHSAPDVLADAVLAFRLLRVGGLLIFDDYLWNNAVEHPNDILWVPKPGIDAFMNVHWHSVRPIARKPLYQLYATKIA